MNQGQNNNLEIIGLYHNTVQQLNDGVFEADALVNVNERRRIYRINFRRDENDQMVIINAVDRHNLAQQNIQNEGRENIQYNLLLNVGFVVYNFLKFFSFAIAFGFLYPQMGNKCGYFSLSIGYLLILGMALNLYYYATMCYNIRMDSTWRIGENLNNLSKLSWWINTTVLIMSMIYLFDEPSCGNNYTNFIRIYVVVNFIEVVLPILFICCAVPVILLFARYFPSGTPLNGGRLNNLPVYQFDPTIIPSMGQSYEIMEDKIGFENEEEAEDAIDLTSYIEGDEIRLLRCEHHFKKETIDKWLKNQSQQCPICRHNQNELHVSEETNVANIV